MSEPDDAAAAEQREQPPVGTPQPAAIVANTAQSQIFRDIEESLTVADLKNVAVGKLLIDRARTAEAQAAEYKTYVGLYHAADKKVEVLREKLRGNRANEIGFAVGLGLGCAMIGLAPTVWDKSNPLPGIGCLAIGILLVIGAIVFRVYGSSK